jgi:hypothetical protein
MKKLQPRKKQMKKNRMLIKIKLMVQRDVNLRDLRRLVSEDFKIKT